MDDFQFDFLRGKASQLLWLRPDPVFTEANMGPLILSLTNNNGNENYGIYLESLRIIYNLINNYPFPSRS